MAASAGLRSQERSFALSLAAKAAEFISFADAEYTGFLEKSYDRKERIYADAEKDLAIEILFEGARGSNTPRKIRDSDTARVRRFAETLNVGTKVRYDWRQGSNWTPVEAFVLERDEQGTIWLGSKQQGAVDAWEFPAPGHDYRNATLVHSSTGTAPTLVRQRAIAIPFDDGFALDDEDDVILLNRPNTTGTRADVAPRPTRRTTTVLTPEEEAALANAEARARVPAAPSSPLDRSDQRRPRSLTTTPKALSLIDVSTWGDISDSDVRTLIMTLVKAEYSVVSSTWRKKKFDHLQQLVSLASFPLSAPFLQALQDSLYDLRAVSISEDRSKGDSRKLDFYHALMKPLEERSAVDANDLLMQTVAKLAPLKDAKEGRQRPASSTSTKQCYHCKQRGHVADQCFRLHPELRPAFAGSVTPAPASAPKNTTTPNQTRF